MKKSVTLSLVGSAIFLCLASTSGQAAVIGVPSAMTSATHASVVSKAGWWWHRHRHWWWWRHHHHHRYYRR